jgi:acyl-CoA dehydrogenase
MSEQTAPGPSIDVADPLLVDTVERLLAHICTSDEVEHAEAVGWSPAAWSAMAEAGFAWVGIAETAGGSGGSLADLAAILRAVGRFAAPAPIAETAMIGGWGMAAAGLTLPGGAVTIVDRFDAAAVVDGRLQVDSTVAWARHAERIIVVGDGLPGRLVSLRPDQVTITPGANLAGEARDRVVVDIALSEVEQADLTVDLDVIAQRGALSRVIMAAGALAAMAQLTIDYTSARHQFGKPVASFQAVQQHLVTATQSAVRAQMAADVAVRALSKRDAAFEVAAARVVVDDAITLGTRAAHQAHGAMGVTREYPLHHLTRRLWAWRHEWGTTRQWRRDLGAQIVAHGADDMFLHITR